MSRYQKGKTNLDFTEALQRQQQQQLAYRGVCVVVDTERRDGRFCSGRPLLWLRDAGARTVVEQRALAALPDGRLRQSAGISRPIHDRKQRQRRSRRHRLGNDQRR